MPQHQLSLERIDDFEKGETVEICIAGTDPPNPMLTQKNSGMHVMEQIADEVRNLPNNLLCNCGVSLRGNENTETGRVKKPGDEVPRLRCVPRPPMMRG